MKDDKRPMRYSWAPGGYYHKCANCHEEFCGDKRAVICADCAYAMPDPESPKTPTPELEGANPLVLYFATSADREEFIEAFKIVKPNCRTVKL